MPLEDALRGIVSDLEAEQRRRRCLEQVQLVRSRLQVAPNSVTDGEILRCIDCLFHDVYSTTPFEEDYDQLIEALSFTKRPLEGLQSGELRKAWTRFLEESETHLDFPLHEGFAWWYLHRDITGHAIAVLEYLLTMIRRGELGDYAESYEAWLMDLFRACVRHNLIARARHVAELIGDYHEDGFVSLSGYAEILPQVSALRYPEFGQAIEEDRVEVERRLCSEYGPLFQKLHEVTRSLVIDAELWSKANLREIEPAAGPRRWVLAVESEFHEKVFQPNREILESALRRGDSGKRLGHGKSCSVGQVTRLIRFSRNENVVGSGIVREVFAKFRGGPQFKGLDPPEVLVDHREQIAHVTERGPYTLANCEEFVRIVCKSCWIFKFLEAIQPR